MDSQLIKRIIEAALLASPQPLTLAQLSGLFPEEEPAPPGSIEQAISALREDCAERGVELVEVASGFRYQVRADVHGWVARLWTERQTKYTRATLETLALIAYRQPITRGEIEQIRGVTVNPNTIKSLEEREWIRVIGHRDVPGKPALFGTTKAFLDYFGLKSLDELPPLAELRDLAELEPELPFDKPAGVAQAVMAESMGSETFDLSNTDGSVDTDNSNVSDPIDFAIDNDVARDASDNDTVGAETTKDLDGDDAQTHEEAGAIAEPEHKHE